MNFARTGIVPGGAHRNRDFRIKYLIGTDKIEPAVMDILFDPQTSGGLMIAVKQEQAEEFVTVLRERGVKDATIIGEFIKDHRGKIIIDG